MIRRHSLSAVCMHWFNAFCWIALLFTGFALLSNPAMQPVGMWWADLWTGVFGAYGLLVFHLLIGSAWLAVYFLYLIFGLRRNPLPQGSIQPLPGLRHDLVHPQGYAPRPWGKGHAQHGA